MTLIDSRPGIKACWEELSERTGVHVDAALVITRLGPPLEEEIRNWFPEDQVKDTAALFRELYPKFAVSATTALPGARDALTAVRTAGGRTMVVTAKYEPNARLHLEHLALDADVLVGDLWAEGKAQALREHEAGVYVGDHTGDVRGARAAGAFSVAVATGPCDTAELRAAGADVVLDDLTQFPAWLRSYMAARG